MSALLRRNATAGAFATTVLLLAIFAPRTLDFTRAPVVSGVVQTVIAVVGTLVALLVFGRYRRSGELSDLLLVLAVLALAWVHTAYDVVPNLINPYSVGNGYSERVEVWGATATRIVAACYILMAARASTRTRQPRASKLRRYASLWLPALLGLLATVPADLWLPISHAGLVQGIPASRILSPTLDLVGAGLFLFAGWRLWRRSDERSDELLGWIATGCVLGAFALICSGLLPTYSDTWLRPSDILRASVVGVWAWGAIVEIRSYWATIAASSRRDVERRIALDLHDGLAQELALFTSFLHASAEERSQPEWRESMVRTADRALDEVRRTIVVLAGEQTPPIEGDLQRAVREIVHGDEPVHIQVEADAAFKVADSLERESVVRIVREAVINAVRHGHAASIRIQLLSVGDSPGIRILDDGVGFDPATVERDGRYGLVSMHERAEAIGATLAIDSVIGEGTTVELVWA